MQFDAEHLKQHYALLSDEALLEIDRNDLLEAALRCYDEELANRDLTSRGAYRSGEDADAEDSDVDPEADETPEWLEEGAEVYSAIEYPGGSGAPDVSNARDALKAAGLPCFLELFEEQPEPEASQKTRRRWRLMVPGELNLQATSILERDIFNEDFEAEWRTHLEMLSDDEVIGMDPKAVFCGLFDRMERVSSAYAAEMKRRGLTAKSS